MKVISRSLFMAIVIALGLFACKPVPTGPFTVVSEEVAVDTAVYPEVIGAIDVRINLQLLLTDSANMQMVLPLPGKTKVQLIRKRLDVFEKGRMAWYGIIDKDPGSLVLISITNNAIAGHITNSRGQIFTINCVEGTRYRITELDSRKFKETPDDFIVPDIKEPEQPAPGDCPDPATSIDVMVVYTAAAETGAGGADAMVALVYECIYLSNLAYQNSNINQRLNLVHMERVTYTESGAGNTDLDRMLNASDGILDNVPTLRDTYSADLVSMIVETLDANGWGYMMKTISNSFAPYGYSVVRRQNAAASLTFPHELGHNMGARHDCATDATIGSAYDYNHGWFVSNPADGGPSWRTVMSYNSCSTSPCTRIAWFSNPNLVYSGTGSATTDPMGSAASAGVCTADNHLTLNNTAVTVANFKCSSPGVTNVWMRDTWNDTGQEPDPNTASEAMWRSPYIWVRNTQDATHMHQFEHQDPIYGQPNWVYVKMINGGASAATGHLEVYYANASVSLTWPTGWTLIGNPSVSIAANSTTVVDVSWPTLPGTGHYCLLARWNSASDPMTHAETADIGDNVRQNNNIIWRNVNIVPLSPDMDKYEIIFEMKNPKGQPAMLKLTDDALFPKHAFVETGEIFLIPDGNIYEQWLKGGSKGTGIRDEKGMIRITEPVATLENIMMGRADKGNVTIRFVRKPETIPDLYMVNVTQLVPGYDREKKPVNLPFGGVSYEICTYKR